MAYTGRFGQSDDFRRDELIRIIEHSVEKLTLAELEALYRAVVAAFVCHKHRRVCIVEMASAFGPNATPSSNTIGLNATQR